MTQGTKATPQQVLEIRKACRNIAKSHGYGKKVSVKMGTGSMRNFLLVQSPWNGSVDLASDLCRFLSEYGAVAPSYFCSIKEASTHRFIDLALLVK